MHTGPSRFTRPPNITSGARIGALTGAISFAVLGGLIGILDRPKPEQILLWAAVGVVIGIIVGSVVGSITVVSLIWYMYQQQVAPPPGRTVLLGSALGGIEGSIIGFGYGGLDGGGTGALLGTTYGMMVAQLTWSIRYNIRVYMMAFCVGAAVELAGGILLSMLVKELAKNPQFLLFGRFFLVLLAAKLFSLWIVRFRKDRLSSGLSSSEYFRRATRDLEN